MLLFQETEGAGRCNVADVAAIRELDLEGLAADQRMWEVDGVADRVTFGGIDANELVALVHFVGAENLQINALATLLAKAGLGDHLHKWKRAAVEDWDFEVVEFHDGVVDAHADEG